MNLFKYLFSNNEKIEEKVNDELKSFIKTTLKVDDDEKIEKVVEKIKTDLLSGEDIFNSYNIVNDEIKELYNDINTNRIELCKLIDEFVNLNLEVKNSIKLYASYIAYGSSETSTDDYKTIIITDYEQTEKEVIEIIEKFEHESKIKRLIFALAKDLVTYEEAFLELIKNIDGKIVNIKYLPSNTIDIEIDSKTGKPIKYYQVIINNEDEIEKIEIPKENILHISTTLNGIAIYDSILLQLSIIWKFFKILEETLLVHRITRSKRFIIFFLDVTGKTREKIKEAIYSFTSMLKRIFTINFKSGTISSTDSEIQPATDLVIPITKESATKVQTIPSDPSATKIDDIKFYSNRILSNLMTSWIFYPERTNKEEIQKDGFIRMVKIYQKYFSYALTDLYTMILSDRGYTNKNVSVQVQFPNPDTQQEIKIIDTIVRRMMIVNQITAVIGITPPIKWIINYVFKDMTQMEIKELISLIQQEIKKQQQQIKGQEMPSIFEKAVNENQNVFDMIFNITDEEYLDDKEVENINEKSNNDILLNYINKKEKDMGKKLLEYRIEVTEQLINYLNKIKQK